MNNFTAPQNYSLEKYKQHCLLLPLDFQYNINSYRKISAKDWKKAFFNKLVQSSQLNKPELSREQHLKEVQENFNNLMNIVIHNLKDIEPLLPMAYPVANCWIIAFFSDYFDKSKKLDGIPQIKEVNYDPIEYAYKLTF